MTSVRVADPGPEATHKSRLLCECREARARHQPVLCLAIPGAWARVTPLPSLSLPKVSEPGTRYFLHQTFLFKCIREAFINPIFFWESRKGRVHMKGGCNNGIFYGLSGFVNVICDNTYAYALPVHSVQCSGHLEFIKVSVSFSYINVY